MNISVQRIAGRWTSWFFLMLLALLTTVGAIGAYAQSDLSSVRGVVQDTSGAVIPGANVQLLNLDTGFVQTAVSDKTGSFHFEAIIRGNYKVTVSAKNFASAVQVFNLAVSQIQALTVQLRPGVANTTVTVTEAAPIVNTTTSQVGAVIDMKEVTNLPLNGLNFTQLALLVPGVTRGGYGSAAEGTSQNAETWRYSETGGAALSVNGLRAQANNYELDGLDNNDALVNTIIFFPPVWATDEFRVMTAVAPAQFGQAGGAVVQSSIRSGTNHYHGNAFFYDRDQIFDANPEYSFGNHIGSKPAFHRGEFGGTLGGPLPFLHHKLFMFGDYQGIRFVEPEGESYQTVPTPLMRTGNFSELITYYQANPGGYSSENPSVPYGPVTGCDTTPATPGTIYNPSTCEPYPLTNVNGVMTPNVIPSSNLSPVALNYLNAFPQPNNTNPSISSNYFTDPQETEKFNDFDVRLDYKPTAKDQFFARYSYGQDILNKSSLFPNLPAGYGSGTNPVHPRGEAVGYTRILTPNLVNDFRYGHVYQLYGYVPPMEGTPVSADLGILNANRNPLLGGGAAINGGWMAYTGDGGPYLVPQSLNQFVDQVTWTKGHNTLLLGTSIERRQVSFFQGNNAKGYFDYSGAQFTGFSVSDMMVGYVDDYSIGVASSFFVTKNWQTGYYAQDDWRVTPRLTLNLGLRYDLYTFPYTQHNYQSNFDLNPNSPGYLQLVLPGTDGENRSQVLTNKNNFAPRIGFAYDLFGNGRTSLRGGFGMYYFLDRGGVGNQLSNNADFNGSVSYSSLPQYGGYRNMFSGQAPACTTNLQACYVLPNASNGATGALPLPTFGATVNIANPTGVSLISYPSHLPTSTINEWNLQLQQQLTKTTSINFAYVGTSSQHLMTWMGPNAQVMDEAPNTFEYPTFEGIDEGVAEGESNYNGLQVYLQSRGIHGVQTSVAYTWSHTLSDSEGAFGTGSSLFFVLPGNNFTPGVTPAAGTPPTAAVSLKDNYGNSDQDQRQVLTVSAIAPLPFGRGKAFGSNAPKWVDEVIGGWQLNMIATVASGQPFSITTGTYYYNGSNGGSAGLQGASLTNFANASQRPRYVKSQKEWFDTSLYTHPAAINPNGQTSTFIAPGNTHRNEMVGPAYRDMDLSLFKTFTLTHGVTDQIRADAFNVTNTPALTNPNGNLDACQNLNLATGTCPSTASLPDNGNFGQIEGTREDSERELQLSMILSF